MRAPTEQDLKLGPDNVQEAYRLLREECAVWIAADEASKATDAAGILKGGES